MGRMIQFLVFSSLVIGGAQESMVRLLENYLKASEKATGLEHGKHAEAFPEAKPSNPMLCTMTQGCHRYHLTPDFSCLDRIPPLEDPTHLCKARVFKKPIETLKVKLWYGHAEQTYRAARCNFLGTEMERIGSETTSIPITPIDVSRGISTKKSKWGDLSCTPTLCETGKPQGKDPQCYAWHDQTWYKKIVTNFAIQVGTARVWEDGSMESTIGDLSGCSYKNGRCVIGNDAATWDNSEAIACREKPVGDYHCFAWGTQENKNFKIVCPGRFAAMSFSKGLKHCKEGVKMSDQGTPVAVSECALATKEDIDRYYKDGAKTPKVLMDLEAKASRSKRQASGDDGPITAHELNEALQYVMEQSRKAHMLTRRRSQLASCSNFIKSHQMIIALAVSSPVPIARLLLGSTAVNAHVNGKFLVVCPCQELTNYMFAPMPEGGCTKEIPVQAKMALKEGGGKAVEGYMDVQTNIVSKFYTNASCSSVVGTTIITKRGSYFYNPEYGTRPIGDDLKKIPIFTISQDRLPIPKPPSFSRTSDYTWAEARDPIDLNSLHRAQTQFRNAFSFSEEPKDVYEMRTAATSSLLNPMNLLLGKVDFSYWFLALGSIYAIWIFLRDNLLPLAIRGAMGQINMPWATNLAYQKIRSWTGPTIEEVDETEMENMDRPADGGHRALPSAPPHVYPKLEKPSYM